jgi:2,3-bisphosphoglycerate-independent phosphoglycerate mutase
MVWLFWGSGEIPALPPFKTVFGLDAAMTSGVDLLRGLAKMAGIRNLDIPGVTDGPDNDCAEQAEGALKALAKHDLVVIHVEAPDEAAHGGSIDDKVKAIERVDGEVVGRLLAYGEDGLRVLTMPDHATPIAVRTHTPDPVPFVLWGAGLEGGSAVAFSEAEATGTGVFIGEGHRITTMLVRA